MKKKNNYSVKGFMVSCIVTGIAYLISTIKYHIEPSIDLFLICYVSALVAFFAYLGFKKEGEQWEGDEILAGFLGSFLALWVPVVLSFIL